jgi:hypothetical protein
LFQAIPQCCESGSAWIRFDFNLLDGSESALGIRIRIQIKVDKNDPKKEKNLGNVFF